MKFRGCVTSTPAETVIGKNHLILSSGKLFIYLLIQDPFDCIYKKLVKGLYDPAQVAQVVKNRATDTVLFEDAQIQHKLSGGTKKLNS